MSNFILFLLLFLLSCGRPTQRRPIIDLAFSSYVSKFSKMYGITFRSDVVFADLQHLNYVGLCTKRSDGTRVIEIDVTYWDSASKAQREAILWHEAGHCELGLHHDDSMMLYDTCPQSVMHPRVMSEVQIIHCYLPNRQYYLENL